MPDVCIRMDGARDPDGVVEVDGHNLITSIRSFQYTAATDQIPTLVLEVLAHRRQEVEATGVEVDYVVTDDLSGWLRALDPDVVEAAALERAGMGDDAGAAHLVLKVLIDMAEGLE